MRFYKPGQTQYQSQFAPLDLNFIQKIGAAKDTESYAVDDMLDKADQLQIDAGMFSKKDEVDKYNQWLKSNVATTRDKLLAGEINEQEAARNISKINSVLTNSDAVKFFNADRKLSEQLRANMAAGKYNQGISTNFNYLDPNNPQITQMSYNEGLDALARAGNIQTPTGIYDKENYQHQMDKFVADAISSQWDTAPKEYNKITGVPMIEVGNHKYTKEELKDSKVREWARNAWEQENRNKNTPFMQYQDRLFGIQGQEYTQKQFEDDAAKAYSGYYKKEITIDDNNYSQINSNGKKENEPPAPGYYNTSATPVKYQLGDLKKLDYNEPSNKSPYPVEHDDTPANKKFMREANAKAKAGGYTSFNELDNIQKKLLTKILVRNKETEALDLINNGKDLTEAIKAKYYGSLKKYLQAIQPGEIELVNNTAIPLSSDEIKSTNNELFGSERGSTIGKLGTGIGSTLLYMDENGREHTLEDLKTLHGEDAAIKITSKADNKNALNMIGGSQDYTNALHVNVEGKRYFTPGKNYAPGTVEYVQQENNKLINAGFNVSLSGIDEEIPVDKDTNILFEKVSIGKINISLVTKDGEVIKSLPDAVDVNNIPNAVKSLIK